MARARILERSPWTSPSMAGVAWRSNCREKSVYAPTVFGDRVICPKVWLPAVGAVFSATQYAVAAAVNDGIAMLPTSPESIWIPSLVEIILFRSSSMNRSGRRAVPTRSPPVVGAPAVRTVLCSVRSGTS